eukprot:Blabericola_migrator_1__6691@NODE_3383_length_1818_cov_40_848087_g2107_i0_p2_GENE_NODE_3383_length_1818_cov_40_848087_g2107_i0NODE_3383_length_1818_cov_40_848087_g2107_i0_p2_ORF_typecomplete_len191_score36_06_NODE_3383_length_1818_cov_40_848087_g2107_i011911763
MSFLLGSDPSAGAGGTKKDVAPNHDDSTLMIPPSGYRFVPRYNQVCGKAGCFECFDIYCERCESKDRRIIELELRNSDLVKYLTQLQGKLFGRSSQPAAAAPVPLVPEDTPGASHGPLATPQLEQLYQAGKSSIPGVVNTGTSKIQSGPPPANDSRLKGDPFAYIQSPVLYDPNLNITYIATTTFSQAAS